MKISILSSLSHPAVIKYLDSFICDDYRIIVMEYANARSLRHVNSLCFSHVVYQSLNRNKHIDS